MLRKVYPLFVTVFIASLVSACGGPEAVKVTETPVPTDIPVTVAGQISEKADLIPELPDFNLTEILTDQSSDNTEAGNFCLADEKAAEDQDCGTGEEPVPGEALYSDGLLAGVSDMEAEKLPDYRMPDLDGTEIRLGDLLQGNKVTLLNVWGVSCGPCMTEMPELAALRREYRSQGLEIIGLTADLLDFYGKIDPKMLIEAKSVVTDLGVDYPILAMTKDVRDQMGIFATPTTWLVNSSGRVIGDVVMGTRNTGEWENIIRAALESENQEDPGL